MRAVRAPAAVVVYVRPVSPRLRCTRRQRPVCRLVRVRVKAKVRVKVRVRVRVRAARVPPSLPAVDRHEPRELVESILTMRRAGSPLVAGHAKRARPG